MLRFKRSFDTIYYIGHYEIVELLIDNNADLNAVNEHGWSPLHWAITNRK